MAFVDQSGISNRPTEATSRPKASSRSRLVLLAQRSVLTARRVTDRSASRSQAPYICGFRSAGARSQPRWRAWHSNSPTKIGLRDRGQALVGVGEQIAPRVRARPMRAGPVEPSATHHPRDVTLRDGHIAELALHLRYPPNSESNTDGGRRMRGREQDRELRAPRCCTYGHLIATPSGPITHDQMLLP